VPRLPQGFEVRQVACGLNLTVVVTVDGRVLQVRRASPGCRGC
jgi:alpha-tubulin suppressor-like RCC1 family protein